MNKFLSKKGLVFLLLFLVLSIVSMRINFSKLIGAENQFFTLFQFFGPVAGGFLGSAYGVITVLLAQLLDFLLSGKQLTLLNITRLSPMLFAAYYFSQYKKRDFNDKFAIVISALAILIFWLHPIGQQAWYFALFWTIPIIAKFLPDWLILRSFGSTFTAHAIGGAIWVWTVPMTAAQYALLVPVVIFERTLFAIGIGVSYFIFTHLLSMVDKATNGEISKFLNIEKYKMFNIQ